jgi:magnesium transporter
MSNQHNYDSQTHTSIKEESYGFSESDKRQLIDALNANDMAFCSNFLTDQHAADIADLFSIISHELRSRLVDILKPNFNPDILVELDSDLRDEVINLLGVRSSAKAISELETDDAVDVLVYMDQEDQQELLDAIPKNQRDELVESLAYPEDSAGRLVEKNLVAVPEFWTVGETIDFLRTSPNLPEDFYQIFVVDPKHKPIALVALSHIMRSQRHILIKDIMDRDIKVISTDTDQEEVAFIFSHYGLVSAPVVNDEGRMIGTISIDDILDVVEEEAHEDIFYLGGVSETDFHSSFKTTVARRFPWLMVNLCTAIAASLVVSFFEASITQMAILAVLMPIMASMGGNAGIQTLTVIIRAIATKDLTSSNVLRAIRKEALVGICNGLLFAFVTALVSYVVIGNLELSLVFSMAAIVTLFVAALAGAAIPIGLRRIGIDPAISSGIFLTMITDMLAFGVFLGLATWILF